MQAQIQVDRYLRGQNSIDDGINLQESSILRILASYAGPKNECYPSVQNLSKYSRVGIRSVQGCLNSLELKHLISRRFQSGKRTIYELTLPEIESMTPAPHAGVDMDKECTPPHHVHPTPAGDAGVPPHHVHPNNKDLITKLITKDLDIDHQVKIQPKENVEMYVQDLFDQFWAIYPKKVAKKKVTKIWRSQKLDSKAVQIIDAVKMNIECNPQWRDPQFIPNPTTFLNQERWMDEIVKTSGRSQINGKVMHGAFVSNHLASIASGKHIPGVSGYVRPEILGELPRYINH